MGKFIVIEAIDAGGSQTQTDRLARRLKTVGYTVTQLHFPQEDRPTGQLIYQKYLHDHNRHPFSKREQALLYIQDFFSRQEDIEQVLGKGKHSVVLSDRFYTSTLAYQSIGLTGKRRKQMIEWITWLCRASEPRLPQPNAVILLDTPPAIALRHLRGRKKDYHESKKKLTAFRNSYLRLAGDQRWHVINSVNKEGKQRSIEDIHSEVWAVVKKKL